MKTCLPITIIVSVSIIKMFQIFFVIIHDFFAICNNLKKKQENPKNKILYLPQTKLLLKSTKADPCGNKTANISMLDPSVLD